MSENGFARTGMLVDPVAGRISPATVSVRAGRIVEITAADARACQGYIVPGFVDAHIHIESSMLPPGEFARIAVRHGTVATVSDPHEIANVCGLEGIQWMLQDAANSPFKFYFGAPSCVPATIFETAGAVLGVQKVAQLLDDPRIGYLSEVMNFPGVLNGDPEVLAKIQAAIARDKPVDGHAPGLRGQDARHYFETGISTDHECVELDEALDKIEAGAMIAIREGSAARNYEALKSLIDLHPDRCMLCSDDRHPDELVLGHIDRLAARAIADGCQTMNVIRACSLNAVRHYRLDVGLLQPGDPADFAIVDDLVSFRVRETFIAGEPVARDGTSLLQPVAKKAINSFRARPIDAAQLAVRAESDRMRAIVARDGQLVTESVIVPPTVRDGRAVADPDRDLLKLVVLNRYTPAPPAIAFICGFGMKKGGLASTVAHDSHNIVAVGVDDSDITAAINAVVQTEGGLSVAFDTNVEVLPLPIAGLMSTASGEEVAGRYAQLDALAKGLGSSLRAPFMTLSFMSLLVIPSLKLGDQGLFDVDQFERTGLFVS